MTDTAQIEALVARIEAATGPNRELDAAIAVALRIPSPLAPWSVKFPDWRVGTNFGAPRGEVWDDGELIGHWSGFPAYSASLDAAITLVPEGWAHIGWTKYADGTCGCDLDCLGHRVGDISADAATPALALCAAALKARARQERSS